MMNQNTFARNAHIAATMTTTENGHAAASTTGSAVLDFYGQAGALRNRDEHEVFDLFLKAYKENPLLAMKALFYARDIRGGCGERKIFRYIIRWLANYNAITNQAVLKNLKLIPEFGRWDDYYALVETNLEDRMFDILRNQIAEDIVNNRHENGAISLCAKWLPSCNASSEETRMLGKLTAKKFGITQKQYRKMLTALRKRIDIVESKMSENNWPEIKYDKIPSRAGAIYRGAFRKHDKERYEAYISDVLAGKKKINTAVNTPQDLVHAYSKNGWGLISKEDPTIEAMWKNLPDFVDSDENILVMADVSGSMYGRPMEVSVGLAAYFAQKNRGAFHNLFMTFDSNPKFVSLKDDNSLLKNLRIVWDAEWGGSTNLNGACKKILELAVKNNVPKEDMPKRLIVVSDMEIDEATRIYERYDWQSHNFIHNFSRSGNLHIDELKEMYSKAGYDIPQVIYWNVESRHNHFQTKSDVAGTMLASGSSPAIFKAIMKMEDLEVTPYDAMLEVLNNERYSCITV